MVDDELAGAGTTEPGGDPSASASGPTVPAAEALLGPLPSQPGYGPAGYPPPQPIYPPQPGFGPAGYPPPAGFGSSHFPTQPGFGPALYAASGWPTPQPGPWGVPGPWGGPGPYPSLGWGFQPGFGPAAWAPPGPGPGFLWGGVGIRFAALVIDAVIIVVSVFGLGLAVSALSATGSSRASVPAATALSLIWWVFALVYHPACWYVFGATPGQKALGLRVVRASNGQALGIGGVLVRYLIFFIVTLAFPLGIVSGIMAANDPFKQAWHDDVARSLVVKRM